MRKEDESKISFCYPRVQEGEGAESIVLLIFVLWRCFNHRWVRGCGWTVSFMASWNCVFSSRDLSRCNKHDSFWLVVSTWYFYILFLWDIVVFDFLPLEIHKHIVLPLSSITFTANSQADNHFYKYIYLFQILYSMKSVFYKIHFKVFSIQVWFKCEIPPLFFLIKGMVYRKKPL